MFSAAKSKGGVWWQPLKRLTVLGAAALALAGAAAASAQAPEVVLLSGDPEQLFDSDVGETFEIEMDFSEAMDPAFPPTISFPNHDMSGTLTPSDSNWEAGDTVYKQRYVISDDNQHIPDGVDVLIEGARAADDGAEMVAEFRTPFDVRMGNGTLVIEKALAGGAVDTTFAFEAVDVTDESSPIQSLPVTTSGGFGSRTDMGVPASVYAVYELVPDDYELTSVLCDDPSGDTTIDLSRDGAVVNLAPDETVTCTFTNTDVPVRPTVTLAGPNVVGGGSFPVVATFSESVTGLDAGDFTVTNASLVSIAGSGASYTITLSADGEGAVSVAVNDAAATSAFGGLSTPSGALTLTADLTAPSATITGPAGPVDAPFDIAVTFNEAVIGFSADDLVATNAAIALGGAGADANSFAATLTPASSGPVSVYVRAEAVADEAGNLNSESGTYSVEAAFDETGPTLQIVQASDGPDTVDVEFRFDEPVTGFAADDVSLSNGLLSNFAGADDLFTATVTRAAPGVTMRLEVDAAAYVDTVGNPGAGASLSIFDLTAPPVIAALALTDVARGPFNILYTASQPISGFETTDLIATNASVDTVAETFAGWEATLTPTGEGLVTVTLRASAVFNAAGLANANTPNVELPASLERPSVVLEGPSGDVVGPFDVTVRFSEPVSFFPLAENLSVSGATVDGDDGAATGSERSEFRVRITPQFVGDLAVQVPALRASDIAGELNTASNVLAISYATDDVAPTLVITQAGSPPYPPITGPFEVEFDFSEPVEGFSSADVALVNATLSNFAGDGDHYSATVTPSGLATVQVRVNAGAATDAAGNPSTSASNLYIPVDPDVPVATISAPSQVALTPFNAAISFSAAITGFAAEDLVITGGEVTAFAGGGTEYTVEITPDAEGELYIILPNASVSGVDGAPVRNALATVVVNDGAPSVQIEDLATLGSVVSGRVVFSEPVSGLEGGDLLITNGTLTSLSGPSTILSAAYQFRVLIDEPGEVTVHVPAGVAEDAFGLTNTVGATATIAADNVRPVATLSGPSAPVTGAFELTLTFSKPVTDLTLEDLTSTGVTVTGLSGSGASYTLTAEPDPIAPGAALETSAIVELGDRTVIDAFGNTNLEPAVWFGRARDRTGPAVTLSGPAGPATGPFIVAAHFAEPVTGMSLASVDVTGGRITSVLGTVSPQDYRFEVEPDGAGALTIEVAEGAGLDASGNPSIEAVLLVEVSASDAPSGALTPVVNNRFGRVNAPFDVDVRFSEAIAGLTLSDFQIVNGSARDLTGDSSAYRITVVPAGDGVVEVVLPAGAVADLEDVPSLIDVRAVVTADVTAPSVTIIPPSGPVTQDSRITVRFSEPVAGFDKDDVIVEGDLSGVRSVTGPGPDYEVAFRAFGGGTHSLSVRPDAARDAAGNGSLAAGPVSIIADTQRPSPQIEGPVGPVAPGSEIWVRVTFDEPVKGFSASDVSLTNGRMLGAPFGTGAAWRFYVLVEAPGFTSVKIIGGGHTDLAGNPGNGSNVEYRLVVNSFDNVPPSATIASVRALSDTRAIGAAEDMVIQFSESVYSFAASSLDITNARVTNFDGELDRYTFTLEPIADGAVSVVIPAGEAEDIAGFVNEAARFDAVASLTGPTGEVVGESATRTVIYRGGESVEISFSDTVVDFTPNKLVLENLSLKFFGPTTSSGADFFRVGVEPIFEGPVSLRLPAGSVSNALGQPLANDVVFQAEYTGVDDLRPEFTPSGGSFDEPFTVEISFEEPIAAPLQSGDLSSVRGMTLDTITGSGAVYTAAFTPNPAPAGASSTAIGFTLNASYRGESGRPGRHANWNGVYNPTAPSLAVDSGAEGIGDDGAFVVDLSIDADTGSAGGLSARAPITNPSLERVSFTASTNADWLIVTPTSGVVEPGGVLNLRLTLTDAADALPPGDFTAEVTLDYTPVGTAGTSAVGRARPSATSGGTLSFPIKLSVAPRNGSLSITATTAPAAAGEATFTYASADPDLGALSLTTQDGAAASATFTKLQGAYTLVQSAPEGWRLASVECTGDADAGTLVDLEAGAVTIDLDALETIACTFANVRDEAYVQTQTQRAIVNFMSARARLLAANRPSLMNRARQGGAAAPGWGRLSGFGDEETLSLSFNASLAGARAQAQSDASEGFVSRRERGGLGLDLWLEGALAQSSRADAAGGPEAESDFGVLYVGLDAPVTERMRLGVLAQLDRMEQSGVSGQADAEGRGWMVGPYLAGAASPNIYVFVRGAWGQARNEIDPLGTYRDTFDSERWLVEAGVAGDIALREGARSRLRLSPEIGLYYFHERQKSYVDSLGYTIGPNTAVLGEATFGPELAWTRELGDGDVFEPRIKVLGVLDFEPLETISALGGRADLTKSVTGRLEGGFSYRFADGRVIAGRLNVDGLGDVDYESYGASLRFSMPLQSRR